MTHPASEPPFITVMPPNDFTTGSTAWPGSRKLCRTQERSAQQHQPVVTSVSDHWVRLIPDLATSGTAMPSNAHAHAVVVLSRRTQTVDSGTGGNPPVKPQTYPLRKRNSCY